MTTAYPVQQHDVDEPQESVAPWTGFGDHGEQFPGGRIELLPFSDRPHHLLVRGPAEVRCGPQVVGVARGQRAHQCHGRIEMPYVVSVEPFTVCLAWPAGWPA